MNKYETLTLALAGLSFLVALLSAGVAIWAILVSKDAARSQIAIAERAARAANLSKYSSLLFDVQTEIAGSKKRLIDAAGEIHTVLCHLFDQYGNQDGARPVRHLYGELTECVFDAFRNELGWQHADNLARRFVSVRYVEDSIDELRLLKKKLNAKARWDNFHFLRKYRKKTNRHNEHDLLKSATFQLKIVDLCDRLDSERRNDLMEAAMTAIIRYAELHSTRCEFLESNILKLEAGLKQNELEEHFSLSKSPLLHKKYLNELAKLKTLVRFSLADSSIFLDSKFKTPTPIGELIYFGSLLYAIQMEWSWGE